MELQMWDELEVFLDNLMQTHPEGRYKDAYPQLKWAMKNRKLPPREEKI
jgi:hypothetical protein